VTTIHCTTQSVFMPASRQLSPHSRLDYHHTIEQSTVERKVQPSKQQQSTKSPPSSLRWPRSSETSGPGLLRPQSILDSCPSFAGVIWIHFVSLFSSWCGTDWWDGRVGPKKYAEQLYLCWFVMVGRLHKIGDMVYNTHKSCLGGASKPTKPKHKPPSPHHTLPYKTPPPSKCDTPCLLTT